MSLNAADIRRRILTMAYECGRSVHLGGSLSMVEILTVLYRDVLRYRVSEPTWEERDRFFLSKGHCVAALYAVLAESGVLGDEELATFMQDGTMLGAHPAMDLSHGIECSSGSLGQGVSLALGTARAAVLTGRQYRVYALAGNGECDEGSVWETFLLAGQWKLDNLTIIIDNNAMQSDGESSKIIDLSNLQDKLSGFGLCVLTVDGHDECALKQAFDSDPGGRTKVIVCNTVKGKGVSFMENCNEWHHNRLIRDTFEAAVSEISGGD